MKKAIFLVTLPIWLCYLAYGVVFYLRKNDDMHFAVLNDIVAWFLDGWGGV